MDSLQVLITSNYFRLTCKQFLHLQPLKHGKFKAEGLYNLVTDKYGKMGLVRCTYVMTLALMDVTETMMVISDGDPYYKTNMRQQRYYNTDMIQCCRFQFVRRSDAAFNTMIKREMPNIGISFIEQPELFTTQSVSHG